MKQLALCLLMANFAFSSLSQDIHLQLDSLFNTCYQNGLPGAAVAIESKGKIVFRKGYGLSNLVTREPIDSITNFNIGSLTKQFTAYCILQLAEQKRLSLNDKLSRFFPGFNPSTGSQITVRQLLTHSSGILDHYAFTDTNLVKHANDKQVLLAVRNLDHTYFVPGTQYRYSNTAYCLLALIIERLSGLSYAEYVRKHIFEPLSMKHSQVLKIGTPISRQATGYDTLANMAGFRKLDADESIFFSTEGDGGIYTSIEDYLRWYHALQKGMPLAGLGIIKQARSRQFPIDQSKKLWYGFGWFVSEKDSVKAVYHTGSNGGFRAIVFTVPSLDYAVIIFSNRTMTDLETLVQQVNIILHMNNKSFTKIESLVSFIDCWPNFAPCKEIPSYSTSSIRNLNASVTALN